MLLQCVLRPSGAAWTQKPKPKPNRQTSKPTQTWHPGKGAAIVPNMAPGNFHSQVSPCINLTDHGNVVTHVACVLVFAGTRSMFQWRRSCVGIWLCGRSPLAPSILRRPFDVETPLGSSTRFPGFFESVFHKRYWLTNCIRISSNKTGRLVRTIWQPAAPR